MQTVEQIASIIVGREGGYVDDPDDPGGATKYGVTIHTMKRLGLDLDGDGDIDKADVKKLTKPMAEKIFVEHYFRRPKIHMLPEELQASVFDMYVNAGSRAVKLLQGLLGKMGHDIAADGVIGPQTGRIANQAFKFAQGHLVDAYGIERRNYYYRIGDHRPASRKYARRRDGGKGGWIKRAEEFISPRYHLTEAEHKARVSQW